MTTPGYTRSISAWCIFLNNIWEFQVTFLIRVFSRSLTSDFLHKKIVSLSRTQNFSFLFLSFFFFLAFGLFDSNLFFLIPKSLPGWCNSRNKVNISGNDIWLLKQQEQGQYDEVLRCYQTTAKTKVETSQGSGMWQCLLPWDLHSGTCARAVNLVLNERHPGLSEGQSWQSQKSRRPRWSGDEVASSFETKSKGRQVTPFRGSWWL